MTNKRNEKGLEKVRTTMMKLFYLCSEYAVKLKWPTFKANKPLMPSQRPPHALVCSQKLFFCAVRNNERKINKLELIGTQNEVETSAGKWSHEKSFFRFFGISPNFLNIFTFSSDVLSLASRPKLLQQLKPSTPLKKTP